jgi:hypothetical protein
MYHGRYALHDQKKKEKTSSFPLRRLSSSFNGSFKRKADSSGKSTACEEVSNTERMVNKAVDVVLGTTPIAPDHPIQRESEWQGPAGGKKNKKELKSKGEKAFETHWCKLHSKALDFLDKESHGGKPKLAIKYKNIDRVEPWPNSAGTLSLPHTHTHTHSPSLILSLSLSLSLSHIRVYKQGSLSTSWTCVPWK